MNEEDNLESGQEFDPDGGVCCVVHENGMIAVAVINDERTACCALTRQKAEWLASSQPDWNLSVRHLLPKDREWLEEQMESRRVTRAITLLGAPPQGTPFEEMLESILAGEAGARIVAAKDVLKLFRNGTAKPE